MRRLLPTISVTGIAAIALSMAAAGTAYAVSGGTYSPPQQDCNYTDTDWNTPTYTTYPGCHSAQLNLESGGITDGNPNNGYNNSKTFGNHGENNIRWVQVGINESPNDPNSKGTRSLYSLGYPGQSGAPHAGCISVNTDGTGGTAPLGSKSKPTSVSNSQNKYGCGNNKDGAGFGLNWDYYEFYCPLAAMLPSFPYKCEDIPGGQIGKSHLDLDTGLQQNLTTILTQGVMLYYGMDDNSDNGEHDGEGPFSSPKTQAGTNGPSDGGGVMLALTPQRLAQSGSLTQPEGLLNASTGFCADGICAAATTQKQVAYEGCDANTGEVRRLDPCKGHSRTSERDTFDYTDKQWDPYSCNSGGEQPGDNDAARIVARSLGAAFARAFTHTSRAGGGKGGNGGTKAYYGHQPDAPPQCNTSKKNPSPSGVKNTKGGMDYWRQHEVHKVTNEPGFQFYEDPDAMGSPAVPIYPLPAIYVGSCGIALGGGGMPLPDLPMTNKAHQLRISTGC